MMERSKLFFILALLLGFANPSWATPAAEESVDDEKPTWIQSDKVKLQGLDKVTGRVFEAPVKIGQKVVFGGLEVYVRKALRAPPEEPNESVAFVEIYENKPGEEKCLIFKGWMVASEPALNPFDHSVYDVWLKETVVANEAPPIPEPKVEVTKTEKPEEDEEAQD